MSISEILTLNSAGSFYSIHIFISSIIGLGAAWLLRERFSDKRYLVMLFFVLFNIALPVIGYLFTVWVVYYLLHVTYTERPNNINYLNMAEFETEFPEIKRIFGEGSIEDLLSNGIAPTSLKMKALVSMSDNITRNNLMMIKNSLSDKDDEIRLYSFAIINRIEQGLNKSIHEKLTQFQSAPENEHKVQLAEALAFLYWDMVYYELSDEDLKRYILNEVRTYAAYVLEHHATHSKINVLLGRVYLMLEEFDESEACFRTAMIQEKNALYMYPYLAEISFNKRYFNTTQTLLEKANSLECYHTLHPVIQQWKSA
jgi:polysaccharide biosynthesis protein PelE